MKIRFSKTFTCILLLAGIISCSKDESNENNKGSVYGSVKLYDKYSHESFAFDDISIEILDTNNVSMDVDVDSNGTFLTEHLPLGYHYLHINKPGYVGIKSIKFENIREIDSLPQLVLFEELTFSLVDFWVDYTDNWVYWNSKIDFTPTETIMVSQFICLNNVPEVSANNYLLSLSGGATNINYFNATISEGQPRSIDSFLNLGFSLGETIYAVDYAVIPKFFNEFYWQTQNFDIIEVKLNNYSNLDHFILN